MINSHTYKNGILYLYFDYNYEFGSFNIPKCGSYIEEIKKYIKKIKYKGSKIVIMVGSIMVLTLTLNNKNLSINKTSINDSSTPNIVEVDELVDNIKIDNTTYNNNESNLNIESSINVDQDREINNYETNKIVVENSNVEENKEENNTDSNKIETNDDIKEEVNTNLISLIYKGNIISIDLEDYVVGVVASEMPASFELEALKAQSVIARTYALKLKSKNITLTSDNSTQNYIDISEMKIKWGSDFSKYYNKIKSACNSTIGKTIKYNGDYIDAVYHSTSNGYTEDSYNVWGNSYPYLKSVESTWDKVASSYTRVVSFSIDDFNSKLGTNITNLDNVIINRNTTNRVSEIIIDGKTFSGTSFRSILGLRSTDFNIEIIDNIVNITTYGYGHGVGLSQYGANGMAQSGYNYIEILNYYYQNTYIE